MKRKKKKKKKKKTYLVVALRFNERLFWTSELPAVFALTLLIKLANEDIVIKLVK
jgi:hypothetical protein